jgi:hypothetical protein
MYSDETASIQVVTRLQVHVDRPTIVTLIPLQYICNMVRSLASLQKQQAMSKQQKTATVTAKKPSRTNKRCK